MTYGIKDMSECDMFAAIPDYTIKPKDTANQPEPSTDITSIAGTESNSGDKPDNNVLLPDFLIDEREAFSQQISPRKKFEDELIEELTMQSTACKSDDDGNDNITEVLHLNLDDVPNTALRKKLFSKLKNSSSKKLFSAEFL